jgi:outer membrane protein TolC
LLLVKTNYIKVIEEQENVEVIKKKVEYLKKNLEAVTAKYDEGLSTLNDLIEAQTKKSNSEIEMQQSLYSYYIALNELEYSIGGVK